MKPVSKHQDKGFAAVATTTVFRVTEQSSISANSIDPFKLELSISDQGEGIPPDRLDKVFQPFFTTKDNGTGLGLAIVHRILEDHQAGITVDSDVGEGTTFRVSFDPLESGGVNG